MKEMMGEQIVAGIRALGVRPGDLLVVHSSLKSFGRVEGGAETVAKAIVEAVSPGGSAFVPVFNYDVHAFDLDQTPSVVGAVTEAFRKLPNAVRSRHPTHSWAGIGAEARMILGGHDRTHPFGEGSPLWKLWERNAWVLLIGVDHRASSMIHVAEEVAGVPYLRRVRNARVIKEDGTIEQVIVRRPGCDFAFNRIDPVLRRRSGGIFETMVGNSKLMLMRASDVVEAAVGLLKEDPAALLCNLEDDGVCDEARELIRKHGQDARVTGSGA